MEVLLIGLGDDVLGATTEDACARHLRYAEGVDHLHMLVWSQRDSTPVALSPKLTVYPVGRGGRMQFMRDALRVGKELLQSRSIEVISTQDPFYTAAVGLRLRRTGIKLQIQNHSSFFDDPYWLAERRFINGCLNLFGKWAVRRADRLRVVNTTEKQKYVAMGILPEKVDVLPVAVDLSAFSKSVDDERLANLRQRWHIATDAQVILWVGRPVPSKDIGTLLRALALLRNQFPKTVLIFGGNFSNAPQWPQMARELSLNGAVRFVGPISRDELPDYFALCNLYAHPGLYEGFGRVMLEAGASAKPVAAARTAGASEIVRDGETGLLCEIRSPEALAQIMRELLSNLQRAQQMGEAARVWVSTQFEPKQLTAGVIEAWKKMAP
jgi:glycosyltransferase involved in cell wall biosynthesis